MGGTTATFLMAVVLGAGVGLWRGGRLSALVDVRLRWWSLLVAAIGIQLSLGWLPTATRWALVLVCCGLVVAWTYVNFGALGTKFGLAFLLAGILANTIVIAANKGMPVDIHALVISGRSASTNVARGFLFKHTTMTSHTSLSWLADRLPIPVLAQVMSFGDVLMLIGLGAIVYRLTQPRPLRVPTSAVALIGAQRHEPSVQVLGLDGPISRDGVKVVRDLGPLQA
jgi:Family of unknown function (DUF5317)